MIRVDGRILVIAAAVVIAATVAVALSLAGSPDAQRAARMDERRVQELQRIEAAVQAHVRQYDALPERLAGLGEATDRDLSLADPATTQAYGYVVEGPDRYRLCAVFDTDSRQQGRRSHVPEGWAHPAGMHCFQRRIGPVPGDAKAEDAARRPPAGPGDAAGRAAL